MNTYVCDSIKLHKRLKLEFRQILKLCLTVQLTFRNV